MESLQRQLEMLEPPIGKVRAVLDTDTYNEIDDQFAVAQMLLSPDRIAVEAIYAAPFHNERSNSPADGMERSYDEILRLLERLNVPAEGFVYRGVTEYVGPKKQARSSAAVDDLISRARSSSSSDPLYVVAIGAISNVASALIQAPDISDRIVVVWLGGHTFDWPDTYEFNLRQDIGGAQVLFDCGVPVVLVPCMGVTSHLHSTVPEIERYVEPHGEIGRFLASRFKAFTDDHRGWSKQIWDMAAVGWLINPDWLPSVVVASPIVTERATWSFDAARHPIRYVRSLDRDGILRDFFDKLEAFAGD